MSRKIQKLFRFDEEEWNILDNRDKIKFPQEVDFIRFLILNSKENNLKTKIYCLTYEIKLLEAKMEKFKKMKFDNDCITNEED